MHTAKARPKFQRKHDRLTYGGRTTPDELACDHALAPFDRAAREADSVWGVDQLVALVSPETAAKFGGLVGRMNAALDAQDAAETARLAAGCVRGFAAMDAEARARGHEPSPPWLIETQIEDHHFAVVVNGAEHLRATVERPGLRIYTMREVSVALRALEDGIVKSVEDAFAGAEIVAVRPKPKVYDDPIEF